MSNATEEVRKMIQLANEGGNPNVQPVIILNYNIDPTQIIECTTCYVNDSWAGKIKNLIEEGWIMFRMQTEFGHNGHHTMAYFAKLKSE